MFNSKKPNQDDLPSSKQLVKSTIIAFLVSIVLLLIAVLPAEYGIDPTGIGNAIGLKKMGEIKSSLADEAAQELEINQHIEPPQPKAEVPLPVGQVPASAKETVSYTLEPGQGIEIKLIMNKNDKVSYQWAAKNGKLNYDTHGDSKTKDFISYKKGRMMESDAGTLVAAFDGSHGWFWRNRDSQTVELKLQVEGQFSEILKM
jgi:hypothetical protein